ncbi:MAG: transposase domain-containing protein [Enhygromyxa sp.]
MYSLIRTCELNGVEPWEYLRDVLARLAPGWPEEQLIELLPHQSSPVSQAA